VGGDTTFSEKNFGAYSVPEYPTKTVQARGFPPGGNSPASAREIPPLRSVSLRVV
jgi:hypothetical protein